MARLTVLAVMLLFSWSALAGDYSDKCVLTAARLLPPVAKVAKTDAGPAADDVVTAARRVQLASVVEDNPEASNFTTSGLSQIEDLALRSATAFGISDRTAMTVLMGAFSHGFPGIKRLDDAWNFLTADDLDRARTYAGRGQQAKAIQLAAKDLNARIQGAPSQEWQEITFSVDIGGRSVRQSYVCAQARNGVFFALPAD